jgi:hypothetical protein
VTGSQGNPVFSQQSPLALQVSPPKEQQAKFPHPSGSPCLPQLVSQWLPQQSPS